MSNVRGMELSEIKSIQIRILTLYTHKHTKYIIGSFTFILASGLCSGTYGTFYRIALIADITIRTLLRIFFFFGRLIIFMDPDQTVLRGEPPL